MTGLHKVTNINCHDNPSSAQCGQTLSQESILATMRTCIQSARSAHTVYLCVLYGSKNKPIISPYTINLLVQYCAAGPYLYNQQQSAVSTPSAVLAACQQQPLHSFRQSHTDRSTASSYTPKRMLSSLTYLMSRDSHAAPNSTDRKNVSIYKLLVTLTARHDVL